MEGFLGCSSTGYYLQLLLWTLCHTLLEGRPHALWEIVGRQVSHLSWEFAHTAIRQVIPRCDSLSINALLHVWACNIILAYMGTGVSCAMECLTLTDDVSRVHLCLMLLNFDIWVVADAAGVVSTIWSLMLGASRFMLTRPSRSEGGPWCWEPLDSCSPGLAEVKVVLDAGSL